MQHLSADDQQGEHAAKCDDWKSGGVMGERAGPLTSFRSPRLFQRAGAGSAAVNIELVQPKATT